MDNTPSTKPAPQPTKAEIKKATYFEIQLLDIALEAYKAKQYLKAAMVSWSFIEEFFLPTSIEYIAKHQNITVRKEILESSVNHLIRYYYLISYDEELFLILDEARKLRNNLVHKSYRSGSVEQIAAKAQESAKYNLTTAVEPMLARLSGEIVAPSLLLYTKGWNDLRKKITQHIKNDS